MALVPFFKQWVVLPKGICYLVFLCLVSVYPFFFSSELPQIHRYIPVLGSNLPALAGLSWWLLLLLVFLRLPSWNPLPSCSMNLASFAALFVGGCSPVWVFPHPCSELDHLSSGSCFVFFGWFYTIFEGFGGGVLFSWTRFPSKSREKTP